MHYLGRIALSLCWGLWLPYLIPFTSQGQDESIALPPREEMAPIDSIEGIKQTEREERIYPVAAFMKAFIEESKESLSGLVPTKIIVVEIPSIYNSY